MNENIVERLWAKTPEQQFLNKGVYARSLKKDSVASLFFK